MISEKLLQIWVLSLLSFFVFLKDLRAKIGVVVTVSRCLWKRKFGNCGRLREKSFSSNRTWKEDLDLNCREMRFDVEATRFPKLYTQ